MSWMIALTAVLNISAADPFQLTLRTRTLEGTAKERTEEWDPAVTAVIVCDMWDLHHCLNAVRRETEMAPRANEFLVKCRDMGVLIIHAPSSCMTPYAGTPARKRAKWRTRVSASTRRWARGVVALSARVSLTQSPAQSP